MIHQTLIAFYSERGLVTLDPIDVVRLVLCPLVDYVLLKQLATAMQDVKRICAESQLISTVLAQSNSLASLDAADVEQTVMICYFVLKINNSISLYYIQDKKKISTCFTVNKHEWVTEWFSQRVSNIEVG